MYLLTIVLTLALLLVVVVTVSTDNQVIEYGSVTINLYTRPFLTIRINGIRYLFGGIP